MSLNGQTLNDIPNVNIDTSGRFKYILIRLKLNYEEKYVIRGFQWAEYHADIYEEFEKQIKNKEMNVECIGGGRILHEPEKKEILVYGYSQGFGRAEHKISVNLLKKVYTDYISISYSNEGY